MDFGTKKKSPPWWFAWFKGAYCGSWSYPILLAARLTFAATVRPRSWADSTVLFCARMSSNAVAKTECFESPPLESSTGAKPPDVSTTRATVFDIFFRCASYSSAVSPGCRLISAERVKIPSSTNPL